MYSYSTLGFVQWFLLILIWEKFFSDKLRSFADLCSVANVSVFILSQNNFGYYIHGHSPTGQSDVDLEGIVNILTSESEGIVTKRSITNDTDDHTYRMALPSGLRNTFNRLYTPLLEMSRGNMKVDMRGPAKGTTTDIYQSVNSFLKRFISRVSDLVFQIIVPNFSYKAFVQNNNTLNRNQHTDEICE